MEERLQKILSAWGVASRRKAEELILAGRVSVNGKTVVELGTKADPDSDDIRVVGMNIKKEHQKIYLAFHKPKRCVTTMSDPEGRETVMKFFKRLPERVYPVGRLDYASEGLLLMTNDGEFANAITAAKNHVPKVYHVKANHALTDEQEQNFRDGVPLHGRKTARARIHIISRGAAPWYEVEIIEGRQNQIRIMFQYFGTLVEKLRRVRIGPIELGKLPPTEWRPLSPKEMHQIRAIVEKSHKPVAKKAAKPVKKAAKKTRA
jgi:23S rRNA pseudouridine2605 synthase